MNEREVRMKFYDAARSMYPNVGDPGVVWVLTQVLGWSWEDVTCTAQYGLDRSGYRRFVRDQDGKIVRNKNGDEHLVVTRKWTAQEKSLLKDWWWLINL